VHWAIFCLGRFVFGRFVIGCFVHGAWYIIQSAKYLVHGTKKASTVHDIWFIKNHIYVKIFCTMYQGYLEYCKHCSHTQLV